MKPENRTVTYTFSKQYCLISGPDNVKPWIWLTDKNVVTWAAIGHELHPGCGIGVCKYKDDTFDDSWFGLMLVGDKYILKYPGYFMKADKVSGPVLRGHLVEMMVDYENRAKIPSGSKYISKWGLYKHVGGGATPKSTYAEHKKCAEEIQLLLDGLCKLKWIPDRI